MAKDHGPSIKDDKQYEGLRKKRMSSSGRRRSRTQPTHRAMAASRVARAAVDANSNASRQPGRRQEVLTENSDQRRAERWQS